MNRRFFVEKEIAGEQLTIGGPDAHHISVVNRMDRGDDIVLFDGSGREFAAKIVEISKKSVSVEIVLAREVCRELPQVVTLAVALPKGERQKVLVEKLVELGVANLFPINCERSIAIANEKSIDRLNRRVIEASKQCGRNKLMQISQPRSFGEMIIGETYDEQYVAHPYGSEPALPALNSSSQSNQSESIAIVIGPEGGLSDTEIDLARENGWTTMSLAPTILRVETAAVAAAVLFGIGRSN